MKRNKRLRRKRELEKLGEGFLGGSVVKYLPAIAGDTGLIPDRQRFHVQSN